MKTKTNKMTRQQKRKTEKVFTKNLKEKGCVNFKLLVNCIEEFVDEIYRCYPSHFSEIKSESDLTNSKFNKLYFGYMPPIVQCDDDPSLILNFVVADGFGHRAMIRFSFSIDTKQEQFTSISISGNDEYTNKILRAGNYDESAFLILKKLNDKPDLQNTIFSQMKSLLHEVSLQKIAS